MENLYSLVIDMGEFCTKVGFGSENTPRNKFFTVTGKPKYKAIGTSQEQKQVFIGNEIMDSLGLYKVSYPISGGDIVNWDDFEAIIDYIFYILRVDPGMCKVLYTTNPFLSRESKKRLFEVFLEKFNVGGYYPVRGALLTMYSGGFDTGLIVDMGASIRITPIYKSYILQHAVKSLPLGGNTLDNFMETKLQALGLPVDSAVQKKIVRELKEQACFTSLDYATDIQQPERFQKEFTLPDSTTITIGPERFIIPELLFKPSLHNIESESIVESIVNVVESVDVDIRRDLFRNIFLMGGSSQFPFFEIKLKQELEKELSKRGKIAHQVHIIAPKERTISNWVGGSILAMIPEFQKSWITRKKFYENGVPEDLLDA
jgi:actin-related protein